MLVAGKTCWRVAKAGRAAFLIDADAYFSAFRHAVEQARQSILIVGWDIDSRTPVGHPGSGPPLTLLELLNDTLARRPRLQVHALGWDFSVIYTFERERLPAYRFAWSAHPRMVFELDGVHPIGASHHQKIVVVDDALAFSGGLDLTIRRWDTAAHDASDPRRVDPAGRPYAPMHDVQVMVEGEAAAALGDLVRGRWRTATGKVLPRPTGAARDGLWPRQVEADVRDAPVGIARTIAPVEGGGPGVREVLEATLAAIAGARRWIYLESQYLTSAAVGTALARRLGEPNGPEIVAVLPRQESGWLEQSSMGILRTRLLQRLVESDRYGRLRLCYPTVAGLGQECLNVHSKVLIADDDVARVGSANLSNRSMGLDSECDLVFDAALDPALAGPIARLRDRLLAEHLGTAPDVVAEALRAGGSLIGALDELAGQGERTLVPLPLPAESAENLSPSIPVDLTFLDGLVCDPERPGPDQLIETMVPLEMRHPVRRSLLGWAVVLGAVLAIVAAWRLTPLASLLDIQRMTALGKALRHHPEAPLIALGAYLVGGLVLFPITLLLAATALVFPAGTAVGLCLTGTLAGAAETYGIGRLLGRYRPRSLEHPRFVQLERQLRRRGFITIIAARMLPVGNFSLINMTAGALRIPFRDYMLGNALGVLPGILGLTVLAQRLGTTIRQPRPANFVLLFALAFALFMAGAWLRRRLRARR